MPSNTRKVKCPYCNFKNTKEKVIAHIDKLVAEEKAAEAGKKHK